MSAARPAGRLARAARRLLLAMLWGVGVAAFEVSGLPWPQLGVQLLIRFAAEITAAWSAIGLLVVTYGSYAVPRWSAWRVLAGYAALAPWLTWAYYVLMIEQLSGRQALGFIGGRASYSYLLWTQLAYGSLFIAWWIAAQRDTATRRVLADAEIARRRGEAELGQAHLLALRGQVDPALVLDVMADVQQRYRDDPSAGDRLLDLLVAFLRSAMPAVRSGSSTIAGEVELVRAWAALARERQPQQATWQVVAPEPLPDLAFPPLLLLPILGRLGTNAPPHSALRLQAAAGPDAATLEVFAQDAAPPLDASLVFRLRVGLQIAHGARWTLTLPDATPPAGLRLAVTIPLRESPSGAPMHAGPHPDPARGGLPWTMTPATTT